MALPCIDDTCSVRATKNPTTKHLQLDVKTSPSGGLYCRGDNTGLAVQLLGEPDNDDAVTDQDLRVPPSNHFEKLRGNLAGLHSIRVNQQWRLIFRWDGERGEADGIYLDDHSYR